MFQGGHATKLKRFRSLSCVCRACPEHRALPVQWRRSAALMPSHSDFHVVIAISVDLRRVYIVKHSMMRERMQEELTIMLPLMRSISAPNDVDDKGKWVSVG